MALCEISLSNLLYCKTLPLFYNKEYGEKDLTMTKYLHNSHAGEILKTEFLKPLNIGQNELGRRIKVPENRVHAIVNGQRRITAL